MKSPRKHYSKNQRTITCTDEEWDPIKADADRRERSTSDWIVECALTEEITPKKAAPRKLVLDAKAQRSLLRDVAEFARGSHADGDGTSRLASNLHALFETRLRTMAREGRREEAVEALHAFSARSVRQWSPPPSCPETPMAPVLPRRPAQTKKKTGSLRILQFPNFE